MPLAGHRNVTVASTSDRLARCSYRLGNAVFPIDIVFCVLLSRRLVNKPAFIGLELAPARVSLEAGKAATWSCVRPCRRAAQIDASEIMDKRLYRPARECRAALVGRLHGTGGHDVTTLRACELATRTYTTA